MTKKIVALIPARMSSTRFPGKPLAPILGLSMIEHVRRRAVVSGLFDDVFVTTCDQSIIEEVSRYGGKTIKTKATHERCTDRVGEAAATLDAEIVVNIQGDEPLVKRDALAKLIYPFDSDPEVKVTNIVNKITLEADLESANVVKVVLSNSHRVLYMSRSIIPAGTYSLPSQYYKQTGLIAFRKSYLQLYSALKPTPLEIRESCDMLRLIENDYPIKGVLCDQLTIGVDVEEQIRIVEDIIRTDPQQSRIFQEIKNY